eukprot:COSAG03_NODE_5116_length_1337_cov_5.317447_1_plen_53_part_10
MRVRFCQRIREGDEADLQQLRPGTVQRRAVCVCGGGGGGGGGRGLVVGGGATE